MTAPYLGEPSPECCRQYGDALSRCFGQSLLGAQASLVVHSSHTTHSLSEFAGATYGLQQNTPRKNESYRCFASHGLHKNRNRQVSVSLTPRHPTKPADNCRGNMRVHPRVDNVSAKRNNSGGAPPLVRPASFANAFSLFRSDCYSQTIVKYCRTARHRHAAFVRSTHLLSA
jgi:hypothetical protein